VLNIEIVTLPKPLTEFGKRGPTESPTRAPSQTSCASMSVSSARNSGITLQRPNGSQLNPGSVIDGCRSLTRSVSPPSFDLHYSELWRERFESEEPESWTNTTNRDLCNRRLGQGICTFVEVVGRLREAEWNTGTDKQTIEDLYRLHSRDARRLAYLLTGSKDAAEDITQDAFIRVIGRLGHLRDPTAFGPYLRRTVVNVARMQFRRRKVEARYVESEFSFVVRISC
jgi:hypothetical protein